MSCYASLWGHPACVQPSAPDVHIGHLTNPSQPSKVYQLYGGYTGLGCGYAYSYKLPDGTILPVRWTFQGHPLYTNDTVRLDTEPGAWRVTRTNQCYF